MCLFMVRKNLPFKAKNINNFILVNKIIFFLIKVLKEHFNKALPALVLKEDLSVYLKIIHNRWMK